MNSRSHRFLETREHKLRLLGVVSGLGLAAITVGGVLAFVGRSEGLGAQASAGVGAIMVFGAFLLGCSAVPFAHWLLGDVARQRLVAAASPLHPLLRRLMSEAPGTYVHSVAAANLSEAAAEAIGADALVARVAAYYHDIGKLARPCYFFENAESDFNPHDDTHPAASVSIITAHVDDGIVLAQQYDLPTEVSSVIAEHHGTSLVRYFYHKASQRDAAVYESDYRYHGRRPTSKESAIVMLADASEASVRAMIDPDPDRIELSVRGVLTERLEDGQLDFAGLSEEEIESIVDAFVRNLVSFRHVRCNYPYQESMECEVCR